MANPERKRTRKPVLEALVAGERMTPSSTLPDPDELSFHPAEDFALAWLTYWRAIGNHVIADGQGYAFMCAEMAELNDEVPQPNLPPHMRLGNNDMRDGARRAMEVLLDSVPGGRDALRKMVTGRD